MTWNPEEKNSIPPRYGCQIIYSNTTLEQIKDPSLPNDAYVVIYQSDNKTYMDLCRGKRVSIFDLYYDTFGPGSLKKIDFGYGRVNPTIWGYQKQDNKKRK